MLQPLRQSTGSCGRCQRTAFRSDWSCVAVVYFSHHAAAVQRRFRSGTLFPNISRCLVGHCVPCVTACPCASTRRSWSCGRPYRSLIISCTSTLFRCRHVRESSAIHRGHTGRTKWVLFFFCHCGAYLRVPAGLIHAKDLSMKIPIADDDELVAR